MEVKFARSMCQHVSACGKRGKIPDIVVIHGGLHILVVTAL